MSKMKLAYFHGGAYKGGYGNVQTASLVKLPMVRKGPPMRPGQLARGGYSGKPDSSNSQEIVRRYVYFVS